MYCGCDLDGAVKYSGTKAEHGLDFTVHGLVQMAVNGNIH